MINCLYVFSLFLVLGAKNILVCWFMLELNLMLFTYMSFKNNLKNFSMEFSNYILFYFIIQSFGSILFLFILNVYNCVIEEMMVFLLLSLSFKMGMVPFHKWVFEVSENSSYISLFFILTFQKLSPFFVMMELNPILSFNVFLLSFVIGSILCMFSLSLKEFLISSSISSMVWMFLSMVVGWKNFLLFIIFYFSFFYIFIFKGLGCNFGCFHIFIFFSALPPSLLFSFKMEILELLGVYFFTLVSLMNLFYFIYFISIFCFMFFDFMKFENIYNNFQWKISWVFYIFFSFSLFFLFFQGKHSADGLMPRMWLIPLVKTYFKSNNTGHSISMVLFHKS